MFKKFSTITFKQCISIQYISTVKNSGSVKMRMLDYRIICKL